MSIFVEVGKNRLLRMSATDFAPYQNLLARTREIALLDSAARLLEWDQETGMPPRAVDWRAEQLAFFGGRTHRLFTSAEVGDWLKACEDQGFGEGTAAATNVAGWRRKYDRATRVPAALVEEFERAKTHARTAWVEARAHADFRRFQPHLETIFVLSRQLADCWGYASDRYDALLEEYEPGARAADLATLFAALRPALLEILGPAMEKSARTPADLLRGEYPEEQQAAFNREIAAACGFDFEAGRIDTTTHPFCTTLAPGDCRLTTRYDRTNFFVSLYGVLHEAGHGMYEQGLDAAAFGTPAGSAASLGVHESQSRLWENLVGRAPEFWERWLPRATHYFPRLAGRTPAELTAAANRVAPTFIRVEADQVTYDLHIILRFEIERALLAGDLAVADVPAAWNAAFERAFGLKVPDDARGCLQDTHWAVGLVGYFPTYTLGNLNAAQLFAQARKERPEIDAGLRAGQYAPLLAWMREKVHRLGQRHLPPQLLTHATGRATQAEDYIATLRARFG